MRVFFNVILASERLVPPKSKKNLLTKGKHSLTVCCYKQKNFLLIVEEARTPLSAVLAVVVPILNT